MVDCEKNDKISSYHDMAEAITESQIYSLNNSYMSQKQKAMVEAVYQFPLGTMNYMIAFIALYGGSSLWTSFFWATIISLFAWIAARFLPGRLFWPIGLLFGGWGFTLICWTLTAISIAISRWDVGMYLLLASFGFTSFIQLPMWLWFIKWNRGKRMNPKYMIAKRMFGVVFPFESVIH